MTKNKQKKKKKKIGPESKKKLLFNILISSFLIIFIIIFGASDILSNISSRFYERIRLSKDNLTLFLDISISGKMVGSDSINDGYYDGVKAFGNINSNSKDYKCENVTFSLLMEIEYDKYDGVKETKEIRKEVKLNNKCEYSFEIDEGLENKGKNPLYSYKIYDLKGIMLVKKNKT